MSSALEKLKALAAAKKVGQNVGYSTQEQKVAAGVPEVSDGQLADSKVQTAQVAQTDLVGDGTTETQTSGQEETNQVQPGAVVETSLPQKSGTDHPLIMELAELEQQLNDRVPDFRLTLRNIHQKLRQDPEIVTILSEEEIGLIVTGLATHAQAEIIAPKAVKAARSAAKKPVSASDL